MIRTILSALFCCALPFASAHAQGAVVLDANVGAIKINPETIDDLVTANQILSAQGILDAFGHVSARDPANPGHYIMARSGAPGLVKPEDVIAFDLDSRPMNANGRSAALERFIHGEIYKARPDVMAIIHTHAPALIPFGVTKQPMRPIYHMGSFLSEGAPVFEIRAEAGEATDLLISAPRLGALLARSLGKAPIVLMRGHGATVVGVSLPQVVFRAVYAVTNADLQLKAQSLGPITYLTDAEAAAVTQVNNVALNKAWLLWKQQAQAAVR